MAAATFVPARPKHLFNWFSSLGCNVYHFSVECHIVCFAISPPTVGMKHYPVRRLIMILLIALNHSSGFVRTALSQTPYFVYIPTYSAVQRGKMSASLSLCFFFPIWNTCPMYRLRCVSRSGQLHWQTIPEISSMPIYTPRTPVHTHH